MHDLEGKVVIITGAAGGLGSALARRFAENGGIPVLLDRNEEGLARLTGELSRNGMTSNSFVVNMVNRDEIIRAVENAAEMHGRIDVLVNNAAVCRTKPMLELDEFDWDEALEVNVKGVFFALQAAVRHMRSGGSVINIASVAGRVGRPTLMPYAASKAAVISITRSAAAGLGSQGIRVNAIAPGMMETEMLHNLQQQWSGAATNGSVATVSQPALSSTLLGRTAQPDEVAEVAMFLASSASSYITGQTLNVCGGIVMS